VLIIEKNQHDEATETNFDEMSNFRSLYDLSVRQLGWAICFKAPSLLTQNRNKALTSQRLTTRAGSFNTLTKPYSAEYRFHRILKMFHKMKGSSFGRNCGVSEKHFRKRWGCSKCLCRYAVQYQEYTVKNFSVIQSLDCGVWPKYLSKRSWGNCS
jgi:hypothetical protein